MKRCPKCAEKVQSEAAVCRYCGHNFPAAEGGKGTMLLVIGGVLLFIVAGNSIFGTRGDGSKENPQSKSESSVNPVQAEGAGPAPYKVQTLALRKLKADMRDPETMETRNLRVPSGSAYLCGEVNANNAFGGRTGFKRFIAGGASAMPTVVEDDQAMRSEEFEEAWQKLC